MSAQRLDTRTALQPGSRTNGALGGDQWALLRAGFGHIARRLRALLPEHPVLLSYASEDAAACPDGTHNDAALTHDIQDLLRAHHPAHPLSRLARELFLSGFEVDLLLLAALPEFDERFGDIFQLLTGGQAGDPATRRPTLATALRVLAAPDTDRISLRALLRNSALWEYGLLADDPRTPFFDRTLIPNPVFVAALDAGSVSITTRDWAIEAADRDDDAEYSGDFAFRPLLREQAAELAGWCRSNPNAIIHVPLLTDDGRTPQLAGALARSLECRLLRLTWHAEHTDAALRTAALAGLLFNAVVLAEAPSDARSIAPGRSWRPFRPLVLAAAPDCEVRSPRSAAYRRVIPRAPRPIDQALAWRTMLNAVRGSAQVDVLANQTGLGIGAIERAVRLACERARLDRRAEPGDDDVRAALEDTIGLPASPLAATTRPSVAWARLVLDAPASASLEELISRVSHRVTVQDRWGMTGAGERGQGLITLMHGESGTGKTLAAEAVASRLRMPLMRVDLSRVVSKYIGETEERLGVLLNRCEGFAAVLLFDEADALFGKRTALKDAHDRYANIETCYLLQRLEMFEGIAILSTNMLQNVDDAYMRRFQFIVHFSRPTSAQQAELWRIHLPPGRIAENLDLRAVAARYDLVGGEIRNAALGAAYAAAASDGVITQSVLVEAVRREMIKRGRPLPPA